MEFRNLTPFSVSHYKMLDKLDHESHVVIMKVGFQLVKVAEGQYRAEIIDKEQLPLCIQDKYKGRVNNSTVLQESDLAPYKPACDVIINATGYAPGAKPCINFSVGVKLNSAERGTLLNKRLYVTGERQLIRRPGGTWYFSEPVSFTSLPLDYRFAFGGECVIYPENDKAAKRIPSNYRLTETQLAQHPEHEHRPIAHEVCTTNPLGMGYSTPWYLSATEKQAVIAPQIMNALYPLQAEHFQQLFEGHAEQSRPEYQPAGFSIICRSWQPRLTRAGTYDQTWLETRHPYLPDDFDFGYWNCAPEDQQIPFPSSGLEIELTNLTPEGFLKAELPHHQALLLLRMESGLLLPKMMLLDTLLIDTENMTIATTWRCLVSTTMPIRMLEARYEMEPDKLEEKFLLHREIAHG
ncbi:DUF2169 domain-containing protein [Citrobacter amalonaticus]|uniref:DUF2169 family type VI secretion system accessory protein n=1 Tax=Citrobacter amalonaticus TaxID=35703 RepID=UPI001902DC7B|nr:DUF2169 domain-containing protein [Citrobacter amalonaticus]MBJ9278975.1 DUF2169 domain-containing protein [Citrobacter amalonaticus]